MKYVYKGYSIDYDYIHQGKKCIVYLHGWLGNKHSFSAVQNFLNKYSSLAISFPPYINKESALPLTMYDYKEIVLRLLALHNIEKPTLVCHSFGCRIALLLSSEIEMDKLVVTGGAGIRPRRPFWRRLNLNKKWLDNHVLQFRNVIGSPDYLMLDDIDKKTFKNIVNLDLKGNCKNISCPTLLYWGKKDSETPIRMCKFMSKHIPNVIVKIVDGGHFAYQEFDQDFKFSVKRFLEY